MSSATRYALRRNTASVIKIFQKIRNDFFQVNSFGLLLQWCGYTIEADCFIVADCRTFAIADDREGMYRKRMANGANRGKSARVCVYDSITIPFGSGMLWNGMENGMEWKENFGMEYGRCSQ